MELISIGRTQKPHGLQGEIKVALEDAFLAELEHLDVMFIQIKGKSIPYFIDQARSGDPLIIKFEDIDSREAAKTIASKELFARKTDLKYQTANEEGEYFELENFLIVDENQGEIGTIEEIVELPQQEMAVVNFKGKEILIPLNDTFVLDILVEEKIVKTDLPDGLLDL